MANNCIERDSGFAVVFAVLASVLPRSCMVVTGNQTIQAEIGQMYL